MKRKHDDGQNSGSNKKSRSTPPESGNNAGEGSQGQGTSQGDGPGARTGSGSEAGAPPDKGYDIEERPDRRIFGKKLKKLYNGKMAEDTVYVVSITRPEWRDRPLLEMEEEMRGMWADILQNVSNDNVLPSDLVRIHIAHRDLSKGDIIVPLQPLSTLTVDGIMDRISTVLQSYATLKADDKLEISIGVIRFPRGEGRLQMLNLEEDLCRKKAVTVIDNSDGKCLARSLAVCRAYQRLQNKEISRDQYKTVIEPMKYRHQERQANELIESLGLSVEESGSFLALPAYESLLDVDIVVISAAHQNKVIYPEALQHERQYYVYYLQGKEGTPGHFHAVKTPTGLMTMKYFCKTCLAGHNAGDKHRCEGICVKCKSPGCKPQKPSDSESRSCRKCRVEFETAACFKNHLKKNKKGKNICDKFWQCKQCRRYYQSSVLKPNEHRCDTYMCGKCEKYVSVSNHNCYQRHEKEKKANRVMIFFDFETVQESGEHIPNLVVARRYDMSKGSYREIIFRGDDVRTLFGSWLFSAENKGAVVMAHNMKGFDGVFLLNYLVKNNVVHEVIYNGSKIMKISVLSGLKMRVIDSLNFFPMPLSKMPKSFGLKDARKGDFPHLFNVTKNFGYIGKYPPLEMYGVDGKSESDRAEVIKWHDSVKGTLFDFEKELLAYCKNDVKILAESCVQFRKSFMTVTGIDPFSYTTIASATMAVFKRNFLQEEHDVVTKSEAEEAESQGREPKVEKRLWTASELARESKQLESSKFCSSDIALVPSSGYLHRDNFSYLSIAWLKWMEKKQGVEIQHALSLEGEYRIPGTNYRVDGYCSETNVVYEYNGCLYHGCGECFPDGSLTVPKTQETREVLFTKTKIREEKIRKLGYKLKVVWEHEFAKEIKADEELRNFLLTLDIQDHIDLREGFFGGRVNACRLFYEAKEDEIIRYLDFTSLYPWTNKYARYPVGHPEIIVKDFKPIEEYFGIAKVKMLPPKRLYHPVLPYLSNGKLKFPLCSRCAANENQKSCTCSDEDRALVGTWYTPEIQKALEKGYRLIQIYQVYHYSKTSQYNSATGESGLFSKFIDTFLKIKQEKSGYPAWCIDDKSKAEYIALYKENEGIELDPAEIEYNPGMRSLAKIILNSFWGKFGQRSDMKKHKYVRSQAEFLSYLLDETTLLNDFHIVNEDLLVINYGKQKQFVEECATSNVVIAGFTTCWARLKLYQVLESIGEDVLYFDTDSVIFVEKKNAVSPIKTGDYLGELTDELKSGNHITSFVSGGPKNYAYHESDGSQTCKVKGFTLNYENSQRVNFSNIKDLVLMRSGEKINLPKRNKICRNKYENTVYNRMEDRNYSVVYTKRRIVDNYKTLPFGYVDV